LAIRGKAAPVVKTTHALEELAGRGEPPDEPLHVGQGVPAACTDKSLLIQ
jgi:hypothetical protein